MEETFKIVWRVSSIGTGYDWSQEFTGQYEMAIKKLYEIACYYERGTGGIIDKHGEAVYILNINTSQYKIRT